MSEVSSSLTIVRCSCLNLIADFCEGFVFFFTLLVDVSIFCLMLTAGMLLSNDVWLCFYFWIVRRFMFRKCCFILFFHVSILFWMVTVYCLYVSEIQIWCVTYEIVIGKWWRSFNWRCYHFYLSNLCVCKWQSKCTKANFLPLVLQYSANWFLSTFKLFMCTNTMDIILPRCKFSRFVSPRS